MTAKVKKTLNHLTSVLPLKEKQESCGAQIKHQQAFRSFVEKGRILTKEEMAPYVDNLKEAVDSGTRFFVPLMF